MAIRNPGKRKNRKVIAFNPLAICILVNRNLTNKQKTR